MTHNARFQERLTKGERLVCCFLKKPYQPMIGDGTGADPAAGIATVEDADARFVGRSDRMTIGLYRAASDGTTHWRDAAVSFCNSGSDHTFLQLGTIPPDLAFTI